MKRELMTMVAATCLTGVFGQTVQAAPLREDPVQQPGVATQSGFPSCQPGYFQFGPRLCMTGIRGPRAFVNASLDCRNIKGRVADLIDWSYRIRSSVVGYQWAFGSVPSLGII
jgi:hypothetical protein